MKLGNSPLGGGCWTLRVRLWAEAVGLSSHCPTAGIQPRVWAVYGTGAIVRFAAAGPPQLPPLLHRGRPLAFLHALWQDRRDSAMLVTQNQVSLTPEITYSLECVSLSVR